MGAEHPEAGAETYRRIRNTFRFLLSNLYDFDPARDTRAVRAAGRRSTAGRCTGCPSWSTPRPRGL